MLSHVRIAFGEEHEQIFRLGYDAWGEGAPMAQYLANCRGSPKYAVSVSPTPRPPNPPGRTC